MTDAWSAFRNYTDRDEHLIVGLMGGTSADAVDAALVRFRGLGLESTHELLAFNETPFDAELRREILSVADAETIAPERLMRLDAALGECYSAAVHELLASEDLDASDLDAIGSHGQTVRHLPRHANDGEALSLQIGSAAKLAERTGVAVVSDFRTRDAAAGGEAAPLVPLVDWWMFRSDDESRVLLNLGGMANVTHVPRGAKLDALVAFDTGPGNAVLDGLVRERSGGILDFDQSGSAAARGRSSNALLTELMADPFFSQPPPRSTGREQFGHEYAHTLRKVGFSMGLSDDDVLATAVDLTATSVADGIRRFLVPNGGVDIVIASGGGVRNPTLMSKISERLDGMRLVRLESYGIAPEAKEALAFAFLAHQTLCGLPGNVPGATGASHPVVLGSVTPGSIR